MGSIRALRRATVLVSLLGSAASQGQDPVTAVVKPDLRFAIRGNRVEVVGLDFNSAQGLLIPVPDGVNAPAAPFTFLLSNTEQKITYGNLGKGVFLDGEISLLAGYAGDSPGKDLTAFWGSGGKQIRLPVSIEPRPLATTWLAGRGNWFDENGWTAGVPNRTTTAVIPSGSVLVDEKSIADPVSASLTLGESSSRTSSSAVLAVSGHELRVIGQLTVGRGTGVPVEGLLTTSRGLNRPGNVFVGTGATFGLVEDGRGTASGVAKIEGSLWVESKQDDADLVVGTNGSAGIASGDLSVGGSIGGPGAAFQDVLIGWNQRSSIGSTVGRVVAGQIQSNANDSQLAVGFNNGLGTASGFLEVDGGILGFSRMLVGVATGGGTANGTVVVNKVLDAESIVVGELLKDPAQPIRSRGKLLVESGVVQGSSLVIGNGSELMTNAVVVKEVVNAGRLTPSSAPNSEEAKQLVIEGNLTQQATGVLSFNVYGQMPGEYDSARISGVAELGGRLDLNFAAEFKPQLGQAFEFLRAGTLRAEDLFLSANTLPNDLALSLENDAKNVLKFEFAKPQPLAFVNPVQGSAAWSNPELWGGGQIPTSINQITLENRNARPQIVEVDRNVTVQSLVLGGSEATMNLAIPANVGFSATHAITVARRGAVQLENGFLAAATFTVSNGGVVAGQGELVGDISNSGLIQIGVADLPAGLVIDGDFTQQRSGILAFDVAGTISGTYDTLTITGAADLDGLLRINIPDGADLQPGVPIPLINALEGLAGGFQLDLDFERFPNLEFGVLDGGDGEYFLIMGSISAGDYGDMDRNGSVDLCDIDAFALGMSDFAAYSAAYGGEDGITWTPVTRGDINGDGDFDFDDIQPFFALVDGVTCTAPVAVPEPIGGFAFALFALLLARYRPTREPLGSTRK